MIDSLLFTERFFFKNNVRFAYWGLDCSIAEVRVRWCRDDGD